MNSLVKYVLDNGGTNTEIIYPLRYLEGNFTPANITCVNFNDKLIINSRLLNYSKVFQSDKFAMIPKVIIQTYIFDGNGFDSENISAVVNDDGTLEPHKIEYPNGNIESFYRGLEDCRYVVWNDKLYAYGTRWDKVDDTGCICIYEINDKWEAVNEMVIKPLHGNSCEKNWGAVDDMPFHFVYSTNPFELIKVNPDCTCDVIKIREPRTDLCKTYIKGSTPLVRYNDNEYITMVHTTPACDEEFVKGMKYYTAFLFYDNDFNITRMSDWFVFRGEMCEFTCGLAIKSDKVYITYSQFDTTSHLLVTDKNTIDRFVANHTDYNNVYGFDYFYDLANKYEAVGYNRVGCVLHNNAALLSFNEDVDRERQYETIVKSFCGLVERAQNIENKELYKYIISNLGEYIKMFTDSCELYYLVSYFSKLDGDYGLYETYKRLGDERKTTIHSYFFKYLNPNYL